MPTRLKVLEGIVGKVRAQLGADSAIMLSEGNRSEVTEVIPTGISVLDHYLLGCGGLPVGRMIEVYGPEGAGKSSLMYAFLAAAQREKGVAIYCETEFAFSENRAVLFGVNPEELALLQPNNLEETYDAMVAALNAIPEGVGPNLLVWDSIAATPPKAEQEGEAADIAMGKRAQMLNKLCRNIPQLAAKKRCSVVFVNQVREKIGVMFGSPETTPGGASVKFFASARIRIGAGKPLKDGADEIGRDAEVKMKKNKLAPPHREALLRLKYEEGWDERWSTISHAKDQEVVPANTKTTNKAYGDSLASLKWPASDLFKVADAEDKPEKSVTELPEE